MNERLRAQRFAHTHDRIETLVVGMLGGHRCVLEVLGPEAQHDRLIEILRQRRPRSNDVGRHS